MKQAFTTFRGLRLALLSGLTAIAGIGSSQAQIVNGSFERWTSLLTMEDPTGWNSSNLLALFSGDSASVIKSRDAHWGQFAVKLTPRFSSLASDTLPAILVGQFPISSRPAGLRFMYKLKAAAGDSAIVSAELYKGSTDSADNLVGDLTWTRGGNVNTYTLAQANFDYYDSRTPDTLVVTIVVGKETASSQRTMAMIDDIGVSAFPAEVATVNPTALTVYPNPGQGIFMLEGIPSGKATARVYDMNGRLMRSVEVSNNSVNLNGLQSGCFMLQVETAAALFSSRLIVSE
jgi:hypothetical protein